MKLFQVLIATLVLTAVTLDQVQAVGKKLTNPCINLSGFEYPNKNIFPTTSEVDYFFGKGLTTIRLPVRWEKLQPTLGGNLDPVYFGEYERLCLYIVKKGGWCIIDVHNYGSYNGQQIGAGVSVANFQDLWIRLASIRSFKSVEQVWFSLMNEPNGFSSTLAVRNFMQAGINAIRSTGANNWVVVNGNGYSGAYSWVSNNWYGQANGAVFSGMTDGGLKKIIMDAHNYLDPDNSGSTGECADPSVGRTRLEAFVGWCRQNGYKAMIGETACGSTEKCLQGFSNSLEYLYEQRETVLSWCWWAGGVVWDPSYWSLLDPSNGQDKPQLRAIANYV